MVDLLLLGLTIALMILFDVVFYSPDPNLKTENKEVTNPLFNEALALKNSDNPDSALVACNKAILIDSTDASGYYLRAQINTQLNKNNEAIKDYTRTLKLSPNYFQAYLNRGMLCMQQKNRLSAFVDFVNAIKISPIKSVSYLVSYSFNSIF